MPRLRLPPVGRLPQPDPALPSGAWPAPVGYPETLDDRFAIARHIAELSPGEVDEELIEEYYQDTHAVLRWIPMDQLVPGAPEHNLPSRKLERAYARMPRETRPPILVEHGEIADGHHRYRVALAAGDTGMWGYDIVEDGHD